MCDCDYCEQNRKARARKVEGLLPELAPPLKPEEMLALVAAIALPILAIIGVVASWWLP
jgi:hypothetical protein